MSNPPRKSRERFSRAQVRELWAKGYDKKKIQLTLGISAHAVHVTMEAMGLRKTPEEIYDARTA